MAFTKERKLRDTISALVMSYFIIILFFQITSRFCELPLIVFMGVAGLILAVIFLFVAPSKKRTMRIVSICCNSITIGCAIGLLFAALDMVLPLIECIVISGLFIGFVFLIYYFIYVLNSRVVSAIIAGLVIVLFAIAYYYMVYEDTESMYNYYVALFYVMTVIHYIIAICTTHSVKNSVVTGMAYGYFGITIAVIIVVAIFLLLASDGDIDFDGDGGSGGSSSKSKGGKISKAESSVNNKSPKLLESSKPSARKGSVASKVSASNASYNGEVVGDMLYAATDILDAAAYTVANTDIVVEDIKTMEELDSLYEEGEITYEEYKRLRKNIFGM
ncbi:MAG: SHOCT domain-containing protein [Clostridia bacterium]|nr:SHOCT domain-containing protein [Clostridia bacterium]